MRVLNPNYLWTCDPYTADHNYMLSKTFKMCDPVVDDRKLDALFCGIIRASPPGSPLSQVSEISGNENQDMFSTRDVDLKCTLDDCNPAAKALAELQVTLELEYNQPGADASRVDASELSPLPINEPDLCLATVARFIEVPSADPGAAHETTSSGSCSGLPLFPSSSVNLLRSIPMKAVNVRVPSAPLSAAQRMMVAQSRPAVISTATRNATLTTTPSTPVHDLSLPVHTLCGTDILYSKQRPAAPGRLAQNSTSLNAISQEQLSSRFVSTNDDKNNRRGHVLPSDFSLSNGPTKNQIREELPHTPTTDPVPVVHSERLTSGTPIQFLTENKGKRKRSSNEATEKKRRVKNKGTKALHAVDDTIQSSSSTVPSASSQDLPTQRRKRARKSTKEKPEVIDVDQESQPPYASPSTVIPQPNGLRQLLPASMRPVPVPRASSIQPPPANGYAMPPAHTSSPSPVSRSPAPGSQASALPFNTVLPNNMGYGIPSVGYAENLGMPPGTFDQISNYSAQYLERQRTLLLRQQMQAQLQQARSMNQTVGTSFVDPRLAQMAPTTTNNGIWSHHGPGGIGPSRTSSLQPRPFDTFGVSWTPPVQATTGTHPPTWYP